MHCVDLGKSFPTSIYYLLAKFGVDTLLFENRTTSDSDSDTAENEPLKVHLIFKLWDLIFTEPPGVRSAAARQ